MAACKRKEETGVSLLSDEAIKQAFLWLPFLSGTAHDTNHGAVDALVTRLDRRNGYLMDGIIHKGDFRQTMSSWRKLPGNGSTTRRNTDQQKDFQYVFTRRGTRFR